MLKGHKLRNIYNVKLFGANKKVTLRKNVVFLRLQLIGKIETIVLHEVLCFLTLFHFFFGMVGGQSENQYVLALPRRR